MFFGKLKRENEELKREVKKLQEVYLLNKEEIRRLQQSNDSLRKMVKSQEEEIQSLMEASFENHLKAVEAEKKTKTTKRKETKKDDGETTKPRRTSRKKTTTTK